jgi:hypothetical protein
MLLHKLTEKEDVQGIRSYFLHGFFTIFDNVLTINELARGEEQAGQPQPHPGGLQEGTGEGERNHAATDYAKAFRQGYEHCEKCIKIAGAYVEET